MEVENIESVNTDESDKLSGDDKINEEEIKKKMDIILEGLKNESLSSKEILYLVFRILDKEFSIPRTQIENEERIGALVTTIDMILTAHFSPFGAISFIGSLGELLLKKHPELALNTFGNGRNAYTA